MILGGWLSRYPNPGYKPISIKVAENLHHREVIIDDIVANFLQRVGWITLPILMTLLVQAVNKALDRLEQG